MTKENNYQRLGDFKHTPQQERISFFRKQNKKKQKKLAVIQEKNSLLKMLTTTPTSQEAFAELEPNTAGLCQFFFSLKILASIQGYIQAFFFLIKNSGK